jgi:hypothetical protein
MEDLTMLRGIHKLAATFEANEGGYLSPDYQEAEVEGLH